MPLHPLVVRLVDAHGAEPVGPDHIDAWLAAPGDRVLFFSGDPQRFPEGADVAVVLPELRAAQDRGFEIGVVLREDEDALARRFGVQRWPSLVFLREGRYVATVAGMHDWAEFRRLIAESLAAPAARAPTVGIPVVAAGAPPACG